MTVGDIRVVVLAGISRVFGNEYSLSVCRLAFVRELFASLFFAILELL